MPTFISTECNLRQFCDQVKGLGYSGIVDAISAEMCAHGKLSFAETGEYLPVPGTRRGQYCIDLEMLLGALAAGGDFQEGRPGLVHDVLPLLTEVFKEVRFNSAVHRQYEEALAEEERDLLALAHAVDPLCIIVSKDEVLHGDTGPTMQVLQRCLTTPATARAFMEKIDISFDGYDDDPRGLFEIEEVRQFVFALDDAFPYWLFFLSKEFDGLTCISFCLLPPYLNDTGPGSIFRQQIGRLLENRWFPAMNHISVYAGLTEQEIEGLTSRVVEYIIPVF